MEEDNSPSDSYDEGDLIEERSPDLPDSSDEGDLIDLPEPIETVEIDYDAPTLKRELLTLAAACNRGEAATPQDLDDARLLISQLEQLSPIAEPTLAPECQGTWDLVFSDTQLFRSSPFFMAGRATCADGIEAERYDWFCDMHRAALAISTIGKVRQIVSDARLVSEFEVKVGAVPFVADFLPVSYSGGLPLTITGAIVSSATIEGNLGDAHRLLMDTVEVQGSNVPLLRQALDAGVALQTRQLGSALETVLPTYANPQPLFRTTYLDAEGLRISRDQDGKCFVYAKASESTIPTDYVDVPADLGVPALLQGMASRLLG